MKEWKKWSQWMTGVTTVKKWLRTLTGSLTMRTAREGSLRLENHPSRNSYRTLHHRKEKYKQSLMKRTVEQQNQPVTLSPLL